MGRFSPTVQAAPSWTNALSEGVQGIGQQLLQRRAFNQQKLQQDREYGLQQQAQDARNAEAGYTPAGITTATPQGLDAISNASVSDATQPASYDPTKSLTYALLNNRNAAAMDRTQAQIGGREDVQEMRNAGQAANIGLRYGSYNLDGTPQTMGAQTGSKLQTQQPVLDQRNDQFQKREGDRAAALGETITHHRAVEGLGATRNSIAGQRAAAAGTHGAASGGAPPISKTEQTLANNLTAKYMATQTVPGRMDSTGTSFGTRHAAGADLPTAHNKAFGVINATRAGMGIDTLPNPTPGKSLGPKASEQVHTEVQPTGNVKTNPNGLTNQHITTTSNTIPKSPTDANTPAALKPLGAKDKQQARTDPKAEAFYQGLGYKKGVDY